MSSKTFILLALAFAFVLLITSEVVAEDLASNHEGEVDGHGEYSKAGGHISYGRVRRGKHCAGKCKGGGRTYCRHGCCGGGGYKAIKGCKCCSSVEEATAYKQTQN